jgi:hypothetical protein
VNIVLDETPQEEITHCQVGERDGKFQDTPTTLGR